MFTKIIDVLFRPKEAEFHENNDSGLAEAIIWIVWFSTMLYLSIGFI